MFSSKMVDLSGELFSFGVCENNLQSCWLANNEVIFTIQCPVIRPRHWKTRVSSTQFQPPE